MTTDALAGAETGPIIRSTGVGVLDRVVAVLDAVEVRHMTASELARHLGLSVPTTHRLVSSMIAHTLLSRDDDGRLHLGPRFSSPYLEQICAPVLTDLQQQTGETAQLWVRRGEHRLCLASVDSPAELRASVPVGTLLPLDAGGSAAKVLTEPMRKPGWAESVSQRTPGLCSVSAPVRRPSGETVAAVCLSAPVIRVDDAGPGTVYGETVASAAAQLSDALHGA
ncbi:IclR family transcriptional regulator [Saccharopolyspora mangrovi]|uniref:Helix-turn-helix domain-containing protein n=1 Tax=Saccharopolyspora mangrovi TaxID=3082379 RepID=A0ABU6AGL4_9PSEU|nr:helix-turn-helix domain-containing protein [Saccharopolyspora sp. S2-29]MEB3370470.1 helix-turn-helix domain-containing protein [Saccharopolyspora sp. S2-29]